MNYLKFDLGTLDSNRIVEVTLKGSAANVHLLDSENLFNYVRGHDFSGIGGLTKQSPITFSIPHHDHWYVVVDMKGYKGTPPQTSVKLR